MLEPYYDDDDIIIYHGDCRNVLPSIPDTTIGFVLTDPPYLVGYSGRWNSDWSRIEGDVDPTWLRPSFAEIHRVMEVDSLCVSFYGWPHADVFVGTWKSLGFKILSHLAFVKRKLGLGYFSRGQHETAYLLAKGSPRKPSRAISDTLEWDQDKDLLHPAQKPTNALMPLILCYAPDDATVLDPFMGSGSTLRAAKDCGFRAIGIEIEERYCELAAKRMEQGILFRRRSEFRNTEAEQKSLLFT